MSSLLVLAGLRHSDLFGGDSLPVFMRKLDVERRPKRASEADRHLAQAVAEQRVWMEEARLGMLQRVQARQEALANEAYSPSRNARLNRLREAEFQLYPKIGENDDD